MIITTAKRILMLILVFSLLIGALPCSAAKVQALDLEEVQSAEPASLQRVNIWFTFQHYYDSASFPQSTHRVYITDAVVFTNLIYHTFILHGEWREYFAVGFSSNSTRYEDNITNMNTCSAGINQPCPENASCGAHSQHHKNITRISDALYSDHDGTPRQFSVLWCDRDPNTFCKLEFGYHERLSSCGVVIDNRPVIQIMRLTGDDTENIAAMSIILAHETAHCLGMDDVYGGSNHNDDGSINCIMDYFEYDDVDINDVYQQMRLYPLNAFCQDCENEIGDKILSRYY